MDDDANVFKAVGPVLVKQDLVEARSNVTNRLDFIKKDIDRIDGQLKTVESKMLEREKEVGPGWAVLVRCLPDRNAASHAGTAALRSMSCLDPIVVITTPAHVVSCRADHEAAA